MTDSKNNPKNCKTFKTNIVAIIKKPKMVRFVPNYRKTKKCVKMLLICHL